MMTLPNGPVFEKLLRGGYRATLGPFSECGSTKAKAQEALFGCIAAIPSNTDPVVRRDNQGGVWVLWFEGRSWAYRREGGSCCAIVAGDKSEAMRKMDEHINQYTE